MSKNIFVLPGTTDLNRGDQALVWESIHVAQGIFQNANFYLLESGSTEQDIYLQTNQTRSLGYCVLPKILKHPSRVAKHNSRNAVRYTLRDYFFWGGQAIIDFFTTSLLLFESKWLNKAGFYFLSAEQKRTLFNLEKSDAVFVKGGGFIHAYGKLTDLYLMYFSLYHVMLAIRFRKKIYLLPNSIGPVDGFCTRRLVRYVLSKCTLVTLREQVSLDYTKNVLKISGKLFPDLGFYLAPSESDFTEYYAERKVPLGKKRIAGITLRPYRFPASTNPVERYENYVSELATFVTKIVSDGFHVVFLAHTLGPSAHEDDRIALKDVMSRIASKHMSSVTYMEDYRLNCRDVTKLYSYLDVMIGTRFHSVIFALNVNVPSIAIAYGGNKSMGIMHDLKLDDYVIPIENITSGNLYTAFSSVLSETENYLQKLKEHRVFLDLKKKELKSAIEATALDL